MGLGRIFSIDLQGEEGDRFEVALQGDVVSLATRLGGRTLVACLPIADARRLARVVLAEIDTPARRSPATPRRELT